MLACNSTVQLAPSMDVNSLSEDDLMALTVSELPVKDYTFDDNEIDEHLPLDNGWHILNPHFGLGNLDRLPPELLRNVLMQIDLQSLTDFRQVNQRAMDFVDSIPQYAAIIDLAPNSIRGLLSVGTAKITTCQDLYSKLIVFNCDECTNFGGYLYLITCRRVCFECFVGSMYYYPLSRNEAQLMLGVMPSQFKSLPQMRSRPGCYSSNLRNCNSETILYDYRSILTAGILLYGSENAMWINLSRTAAERRRKFDRKLLEWEKKGSKDSRPRKPQTFSSTLIYRMEPRRFMAIVRFPALEISTRGLEWGFLCKECLDVPDGGYKGLSFPFPWTRKFNAETFRRHLESVDHKKR